MRIFDSVRTWARHVKRDGVALWFALRHPRTPWYAKAVGGLAVAYALSPIDLIPDFIPLLGYLDDVLLLPGLIWLAARLMPQSVLQACRMEADEWLEREGSAPRTRWGIVFVIVVWLGLAGVAGAWWAGHL